MVIREPAGAPDLPVLSQLCMHSICTRYFRPVSHLIFSVTGSFVAFMAFVASGVDALFADEFLADAVALLQPVQPKPAVRPSRRKTMIFIFFITGLFELEDSFTVSIVHVQQQSHDGIIPEYEPDILVRTPVVAVSAGPVEVLVEYAGVAAQRLAQDRIGGLARDRIRGRANFLKHLIQGRTRAQPAVKAEGRPGAKPFEF